MEKIGPTIEAVVKITERCNINCTYCYVFNKGDDSYKRHDAVMAQQTVDSLSAFLLGGVRDLGASKVQIDFHGGEPLMMKKSRFDDMCRTIAEALSVHCDLQFGLQTNAMLVDAEWIELFRKYNMSIGVSLDGPASINDAERVDHRGRGTYSRVRKGVDLLIQARKEGVIPGLGILTVANPKNDGIEIYRHITRELEIDALDFLLPIDSHDSFNASEAGLYGPYLCSLYDEWQKEDEGIVQFRLFQSVSGFLRSGVDNFKLARDAREGQHVIVTVASNGDLGPDDSLRTLDIDLFSGFNVGKDTLQDFLASEKFRQITEAEDTLPGGCIECAWQYMCRGGAANGRLINRYSKQNGFNNRSIVCEGLQELHAHVAADMLKRGLGFERLKTSLLQNDSALKSYAAPCNFSDPHLSAL